MLPVLFCINYQMVIVVLDATVASTSYPTFITALPPQGKGRQVKQKTTTDTGVLLFPFM